MQHLLVLRSLKVLPFLPVKAIVSFFTAVCVCFFVSVGSLSVLAISFFGEDRTVTALDVLFSIFMPNYCLERALNAAQKEACESFIYETK